MNVTVREGQFEHAIRILRKRMQRAGIFQYIQKKKHNLTLSQIKKEKKNDKRKVINKFLKNRMKKEGY